MSVKVTVAVPGSTLVTAAVVRTRVSPSVPEVLSMVISLVSEAL